jgi:hypothetical protein
VKEMGCYVYHVDESLLVPVSGVYHSVSASLWWVSTSFTDYVTELWVEGHRFLWNHYQTEGPHTTNHLEGWDNKIKKKVHHALYIT